jgi:hypothetical protein
VYAVAIMEIKKAVGATAIKVVVVVMAVALMVAEMVVEPVAETLVAEAVRVDLDPVLSMVHDRRI